MTTFAIKLKPGELANPGLDIRYTLPAILKERSGGLIEDQGYDYATGSNDLVLFVAAQDWVGALAHIVQVITSVPVLGNRLQGAATVAVMREDGAQVIYPVGSQEPFVI